MELNPTTAQGGMMRAVIISGCALALGGCMGTTGGNEASKGPRRLAAVEGYTAAYDASGALVVMRQAAPFANYEGAEAKRAANAICGGAVASSINDTYRDGAWVFPMGCGNAA
ncbi:hypothetical protein BMG03_08275 [Thioclava nitratireducens]|uniref:Uncharacterized protein n=1 Tax=Thioclava nitratireducens TaxID=1915078 RepID=A0ABM6IGA9_9RHOB|nr:MULTISPECIES: hypothetical protein [Thioclava]AQS47801.1 hypothetical protein BMG03_08275 [Thioclava nitratireducens]OWY10749.1 hypothetical protein B6V74_01610 [Thioclava sp. F42-5]